MADHVLERRVWLPRPRREVFTFLADPRNLALVTPPAARLRWLAPPPDTLQAGSVIDFSVRVWRVPIRWRVFVRELDPPHRFVDVQIWGPFARWEHRHQLVEGTPADGRAEPRGTWMEDRVTYRLPLGVVGRLAHAASAERQIARLFDYRERRLREFLGS
jgi:uncharacterized protein